MLGLNVGDDGSTAYVLTEAKDSRSILYSVDLKTNKTLWKSELTGAKMVMAGGPKFVVTVDRTAAGLLWQRYELSKGDKLGLVQGAALQGEPSAVTVDSRGRFVWIGTDAGMVGRFVPGDFRQFATVAMENGGARSLALAPKSKACVVGGNDGTLRLLDGNTCKVEGKPWQGHSGPVTAVLWDDSGVVISGDETGRIVVRAGETGKERFSLQAHQAAIQCIAVHPKQSWVASGDASGRVRLSHLGKGDELAVMAITKVEGPIPSLEGKARPEGARTGVVGLAFVDGGARLIAAGGKVVVAFDVSQVRGK